jgi:predicted MFS family arabinose efflux permease
MFLNRYLEELGASKAQIGLYMGIFGLGSVAARTVVGSAADKYGRKRVIYFGVSLMLVATTGYFLLQELNRLGMGFAGPAVAAAIVDKVAAQDTGKALALFTASFDFGAMTGSFGYGALAGQIGYAHMYLVAGCVAITAVGIAWFFRN